MQALKGRRRKINGVAVVVAACFAGGGLDPAFGDLVWTDPIAVPVGVERHPYDAEANCCFSAPSADFAADGSFVVGWADGATRKVRRFGPSGQVLTAEIVVPSGGGLSSAPDGSFKVLSLDSQPGPTLDQLWARPFDAAGSPGTPILVAQGPSLGLADIEHDDFGRFAVLYAAEGTSASELFVVLFAADGTPLGQPILVESVAHSLQDADLALTPDGRFAVSFARSNPVGLRGVAAPEELYVRFFAADGLPDGTAHLVPPGGQLGVHAAAAPDGRWALTYPIQLSSHALQGWYYGADGSLGNALELWNQITDEAGTAASGFLADGSLVAVSQINVGDSFNAARLHRFGAAGTGIGPFLRVDTGVGPVETGLVEIATLEDRVLALWEMYDATPSSNYRTVSFQLFEATLFADTFETGDLSGWSASSP